jgi:subfamily B ATP-binding cassette protein MsbA
MVAVLAAFGLAMAYAFRRLRPLFYERGHVNAEVTGRLNETLGGIRIVKSYTAEDREHVIFSRGVDRLFGVVRRSMTAASATTAMSTLVVGMIAVVIILLGGRAVIDGGMTVGDLVMYIFFVALVNTPVVQVASILTQLTDAISGLDRIHELRSVATEDEEDVGRAPLGDIRGEIRFEAVGFEYTPGVAVLKDVSFTAPAGSTTALVGPSGSGKSTLIGLVMGFHRPSSGRILVDGRDLASIKLRDYRDALGAVLQDNFLFDGTLAENIRFSKPDASLDEVRRVSRIAHCDDFVERLEDQYETLIGERGVRLSGGQRQRVAIARAILADPGILILDEATSSLDSESEAKIQDGLRSLRRGRTTFVIAHRLSTIRSADQILVLDRGVVVESGTHPQLMARHGLYRQLHDRQHALEQDRFINPGEEFAQELEESQAPDT